MPQQQKNLKGLACLSCRPRKIKCERVDGSCERCRSLKIPCRLPERDERQRRYSKEYIIDLENQVQDLKVILADLQSQLQAQQASHASKPCCEHTSVSPQNQAQGPNNLALSNTQHTPEFRERAALIASTSNFHNKEDAEMAEITPGSSSISSESIITRLCGTRIRLNSGVDGGHSRYFGPTSSLHLTESVASILSYCDTVSRNGSEFEKEIPEAMQQYLLGLYWKYQHNVMRIIHKEAFLAGLEAGRGPYYSRCLLLCILASGARISANPEIRALSIASVDEDNVEKPALFKLAQEALEQDLLNPSITTIQSLMLLSVLDCVQSDDMGGWLKSGTACRLAFDLGLHQDWSNLSQSRLSQIDIEVRNVVFWGCFGLDRHWGLYLGRPPIIKLCDVYVQRPTKAATSWDAVIFVAWTEILDIAGQISEKLNTNACFQEQIDFYMDALQKWDANLDHAMIPSDTSPPAVYQLRMQYCALFILLNRHNAGLGCCLDNSTPEMLKSRRACVEHALQISKLIQDYTAHHQAYTMIGSSLYHITMAATTLIAEIAERKKNNVATVLAALTTCLSIMKQMESAEIVALNVRKIVQTIMRVCDLQRVPMDMGRPTEPIVHEIYNAPRDEMGQQSDAMIDTSVLGRVDENASSAQLQYDPILFNNVFQFPFEDALMDPYLASDFFETNPG